MPFIEASDGTEIYVKSWGEGPAVVFIHGWPLSADSWDEQMQAVADAGFQAIAYDRRGFGRSEQPGDGYDYDRFADDLAEVLDARGAAKDITLVGFSMGGGEVARFMSRHAGAGVSRVVLIGSVVPFLLQTDDHPAGAPRAVFDGMKAGIAADRPGFLAGFLRTFYGADRDGATVGQPAIDASFQVAMQAGLRGTLACVDAFGTTDFRTDCAAINVPTLIIHGTADDIVPIDISGRAAAGLISDARLVEIDGGPHGLLATHGPRITAELLSFLRG